MVYDHLTERCAEAQCFSIVFVTVARDRDSDSEDCYFGRVIFSVYQFFVVPGPIFAKLYHTTHSLPPIGVFIRAP